MNQFDDLAMRADRFLGYNPLLESSAESGSILHQANIKNENDVNKIFDEIKGFEPDSGPVFIQVYIKEGEGRKLVSNYPMKDIVGDANPASSGCTAKDSLLADLNRYDGGLDVEVVRGAYNRANDVPQNTPISVPKQGINYGQI